MDPSAHLESRWLVRQATDDPRVLHHRQHAIPNICEDHVGEDLPKHFSHDWVWLLPALNQVSAANDVLTTPQKYNRGLLVLTHRQHHLACDAAAALNYQAEVAVYPSWPLARPCHQIVHS
jgi:hypothetical protein